MRIQVCRHWVERKEPTPSSGGWFKRGIESAAFASALGRSLFGMVRGGSTLGRSFFGDLKVGTRGGPSIGFGVGEASSQGWHSGSTGRIDLERCLFD